MLLTDPFLQLPTENSVQVVWFTEFKGQNNFVSFGDNLDRQILATTTKLTRIREDNLSHWKNQTQQNVIFSETIERNIWRHQAIIKDLKPGKRVPYSVTSVREDGETFSSRVFSLTPAPLPGKSLKILLTSDHQLKPMTAANMQKVVETVGKVDAVFFAGDLVNIPDRASEWFDDDRGNAFFPCLQGRANYPVETKGIKTLYKGGELIQNAPLFAAIGNHEVIGRFSMETTLNQQFNDTFPRWAAEELYHKKQAENGDTPALREAWIKDNSFNTDTYEEIFSLPESKEGGKKYYAVTFGDVRLVVLYMTNMWRSPSLTADNKGKYREREEDFNNPENWGYGQILYEPIAKGSRQYQWLEKELNSPEFNQAKYKIVMFHHPPHSLGENAIPAYTDPVQIIEKDGEGKITSIAYEYPLEADYIIRDVVPLLEKAGVQLVYYGHSHLWNRFVSPSGLHFLESSNVGNSYGAYVGNLKRRVPVGYRERYVEIGDANGLEPIVPSLVPVLGEDGKPQPFIASNNLTVFSIFDSHKGSVSSYYFDTQKPDSEVVKFDEFRIVDKN